MQEGIVRAIVGDAEFDFELRDGVLSLNGEPVDASLVRVGPTAYSLLLDGKSYDLTIRTNATHLEVTGPDIRSEVKLLDRIGVLLAELKGKAGKRAHTLEIRAPMPGLVLAVEVDPHAEVSVGQGVIVLEAMKMENEIFAAGTGVVEAIHVTQGEAVTKGQLLVTLRET